MSTHKSLSQEQHHELLKTLTHRFEKNMKRHKGLTWGNVLERLETYPDKLWSLHQMEASGGEPDVVGIDKNTGAYLFVDCSTESPKGRRSLCYDRQALKTRKENQPKGNVLDTAKAMGIELLNEEEYLYLQQLGKFDTKTSSWIKTPTEIRELGGALFCDFRYGKVFTYHNSAQSYYSNRAFRGLLRV